MVLSYRIWISCEASNPGLREALRLAHLSIDNSMNLFLLCSEIKEAPRTAVPVIREFRCGGDIMNVVENSQQLPRLNIDLKGAAIVSKACQHTATIRGYIEISTRISEDLSVFFRR